MFQMEIISLTGEKKKQLIKFFMRMRLFIYTYTPGLHILYVDEVKTETMDKLLKTQCSAAVIYCLSSVLSLCVRVCVCVYLSGKSTSESSLSLM